MTAPSFVSLRDFSETWADRAERPVWAPPDSAPPLPDHPGVRARLDDVLDTVVALQRAEWLQDGMYLGPRAHPDLYRDVLHGARVLEVSVPPAILTARNMRDQSTAGSDARPFLVLSSFFQRSADRAEQRFATGRLLGHVALRDVSALNLYALLVDHAGIRQVARRAVGPLLEVVLAPLGLGMRLALSRWHRLAELAADRAGLVCADDLEASRRALLRMALATTPGVDAEAYLAQLRATADEDSPGKWAELLASEPWLHKRMSHLEWFAAHRAGTLSRDDLERQTRDLLGVG